MTARPDPRQSAHRRGYDGRWRRYRVMFLRRHPLCVLCQQQGKATSATVVDHIIPHRGDPERFWDESNHQPLCKPCHDGAKRAQELRGLARGCGPDGIPLDVSHPWRE